MIITRKEQRNQIANPYYWTTERQQFTQLRCLNLKVNLSYLVTLPAIKPTAPTAPFVKFSGQIFRNSHLFAI